MKTVLFVPGFYENIDSRDYRSTLKAIELKGYKTKFININWKRTTIEDWVPELEKIYKNHSPNDVILAGFSFGAVTALIAAAHKNPSSLWLFSLSPYLSEDIRLTSPDKGTLRIVGKKRLKAFGHINVDSIYRGVKCPVLLFCGDIERKKWPDIGKRADETNTKLQNSQLINIPNVGHNVEDPTYISGIKRAI